MGLAALTTGSTAFPTGSARYVRDWAPYSTRGHGRSKGETQPTIASNGVSTSPPAHFAREFSRISLGFLGSTRRAAARRPLRLESSLCHYILFKLRQEAGLQS
jgi:hypothetical protein